jgi:multiple sugar transport system permease protein
MYPKTSAKEVIINILKYLSLAVATFAVIYPLLVVFFGSFKTRTEFYNTSKIAPPQSFLNFENYVKAFIKGGMLRGSINTFFIILVSLTVAVLFSAMVSYVLARFDFIGKKLIMIAYLTAMMIPMVTTQVATYKIVNALHLINTIWAPIVLYVGTDAMSIYIMLQFINNIDVNLDEAAMIEGASYYYIFFRIIFPLLKPAIVTIAIIKGVAIYNDFYIPFLYMPSRDLQTLSTSLYNFMGPFGGEWNVICAGVILILIPTIILFIALQRYIYSGFTEGAIK